MVLWFIDHTLLKFAFLCVESLSIVKSKGQTILHNWPWPWKSVFKVTSHYDRFQYKANMIQSCLFSVTNETQSTVTWKIYTNEFAAKAEFFQMKARKHTSVPTMLRVGGGVIGLTIHGPFASFLNTSDLTKQMWPDWMHLQASGPTMWNSLPVALRSTDAVEETFRRHLKTFLTVSIISHI